ncbi:MAG: hypothetical protein ACLQM8_15355 [Limisphaerales bacterium]
MKMNMKAILTPALMTASAALEGTRNSLAEEETTKPETNPERPYVQSD